MTVNVADVFRIEDRKNLGTGASRVLRSSGMVPAVLYGDSKDNEYFAVDERDIVSGLDNAKFFSTVYNIKVGGKMNKVLVKDVQFHPVTDMPLHIDFIRVAKNAKTHVNIPIRFENEEKCPGIKKGGVLNIVMHSLEIKCLVENIPNEIVIDLKDLDISGSIHTVDIALGEGVVPAHPERDVTIATIVTPSSSEAESTEEETTDTAEEE